MSDNIRGDSDHGVLTAEPLTEFCPAIQPGYSSSAKRRGCIYMVGHTGKHCNGKMIFWSNRVSIAEPLEAGWLGRVMKDVRAESSEVDLLRQHCARLKGDFDDHTQEVARFLSELHGIMVDPVADGTITVAEMTQSLLTAARRARVVADEREGKVHALHRALFEVMTWIHNWDAPFTEDPDWAETEQRAKKVLAEGGP
jgi:hypothetical protein